MLLNFSRTTSVKFILIIMFNLMYQILICGWCKFHNKRKLLKLFFKSHFCVIFPQKKPFAYLPKDFVKNSLCVNCCFKHFCWINCDFSAIWRILWSHNGKKGFCAGFLLPAILSLKTSAEKFEAEKKEL